MGFISQVEGFYLGETRRRGLHYVEDDGNDFTITVATYEVFKETASNTYTSQGAAASATIDNTNDNVYTFVTPAATGLYYVQFAVTIDDGTVLYGRCAYRVT